MTGMRIPDLAGKAVLAEDPQGRIWVSDALLGTRPLGAVQAGTAVSSRVREGMPNSVNLLRWSPAPGSCRIERTSSSDGIGTRKGASELKVAQSLAARRTSA